MLCVSFNILNHEGLSIRSGTSSPWNPGMTQDLGSSPLNKLKNTCPVAYLGLPPSVSSRDSFWELCEYGAGGPGGVGQV